MAKSINWPASYKREVIAEDTQKRCIALRLGRLYYDNAYWVDGESVLVRVNHKVIRKAKVVGPLKCCAIADLTDDDLKAEKANLQTKDAVVAFLAETYNQPVSLETEVTAVYYQNEPIDLDILEVEDDPHMT